METAGKLVEEEELKDALRERGLGTPATRAAIIETLLTRGYLRRDKKNLAATDLGRYLIALVRDPRLKSAELTGEWEARLRRIEQGELDPRRFIDDIVRYTSEIIHADERHPIDPTRLGECPRCGAPVIEGKRDFGCSRWREGCPFVLRRDFRGVELTTDHVRELLQRRTLPWPAGGADASPSLLYLSDAGSVFEIPKATPDTGNSYPRRPATKRGKRSRGAKTPAPTRSPARRKTPVQVSTPDAAKPPKRKPRRTTRSTRAENSSETDSLGVCPLCGRPVREQKKSFSCSGWREGCSFAIWKEIAGKPISRRMAETLLSQGVTSRIKGFRSKAGKPFEARLKLEDGRVQFDFLAE
jgi:DNA topoisomerase-3